MAIISTDPSYTFTVTGDRTLTATFEQIPVYTITATIDPPDAGTVTGAGEYQEGTTVTLTATVNDGYKFTGWQENGSVVSTNNPYIFTVTENKALVGMFEEWTTLPDGYQRVEYIQNVNMNTTMRLLTGVIPSMSTGKIEAEIYTDSSTRNILFGGQLATGSYYMYISRSSIQYRFSTTTTTAITKNISIDSKKTKVIVDFSDKTITIGDNIFSGFPVSALKQLILFNYVPSGSMSSGSYGFNGRIYSFKIYNSGELVCELIPCIAPSGDGCYYNTVNKNTYISSDHYNPGPAV